MQVTETSNYTPTPEVKPLTGRPKELHDRLEQLRKTMRKESFGSDAGMSGLDYRKPECYDQNTGLAGKVTLAQFLAASKYDPAIRTELVGRCMLQRNIDKLNKHLPFEYNLDQAPLHLLDHVTLDDLQRAGFPRKVPNTETYLALVENFRFKMMDIASIADEQTNGYFSEKCWQMLAFRLEERDNKGADRSFSSFSPPSPIPSEEEKKKVNCTVKGFRSRSPQELAFYAAQIPDQACRLVSDAQLKELDLTKFSPAQLDCMMRGSGGEETLLRRIQCLSQEQRDYLAQHVQTTLQQYLVDYSKLSLNSLSKDEIETLLESNSVGFDSKVAERFHQIPPHEVAAAIDKINKPWRLKYLSEEQIKALDFSKLSEKKIWDLVFDSSSAKEKRSRVRHIPLQEIPRLMHHQPWTGRQILLDKLSAEQLHAVDFELVDATVFRIFLHPFTVKDYGLGRQYTQEVKEGEIFHKWVDDDGGWECRSDKDIQWQLERSKPLFKKNWNKLSEEQKEQVSKRLGWELNELKATLETVTTKDDQ